MRILITGGAGYIGSFILRALEDKYELLVLDSLEEGHIWAVGGHKLVVGDIGDEKILNDIYENFKPDVIIHCAAYIIAPESCKEPFKYYENNFYKSLKMLKFFLERNLKYFIFSSTAAVYGNPKYLPIDESHPIEPLNPYGWSKFFFERAIMDLKNVYDFEYIILRYFNTAGASLDGKLGQYKKEPTHLISRIIRTILGFYDRLEIYGNDYPTKDGTAIRDYIHILDLAQLHKIALEYLLENKKSEIINLGYGRGYSVLEVVELANKILKPFKYEFTKRREGDPAILIADNKKMKLLFNFVPKYDDMELILKTSYNWEIYRIENNLK
ncbi:MAG: UDP-glucose 4-epimerase GalE [candidate division WOR-3 bacterium]